MENIFIFTPKLAYMTRDKAEGLLKNQDFDRYLYEMADTELVVEIKPKAKYSEKKLMYAYYHGPLLSIAVKAYTKAGYEMMDKVKADYLLKSECAVSTMIKDGQEVPYLEDKAAMDKKRLHKYITDCIVHLETNLEVSNIPDAEEYKLREVHGMNFSRIK